MWTGSSRKKLITPPCAAHDRSGFHPTEPVRTGTATASMGQHLSFAAAFSASKRLCRWQTVDQLKQAAERAGISQRTAIKEAIHDFAEKQQRSTHPRRQPGKFSQQAADGCGSRNATCVNARSLSDIQPVGRRFAMLTQHGARLPELRPLKQSLRTTPGFAAD
jgi:hypothetical protein